MQHGMLSRDELAAQVSDGSIDTVIVAFTDMYGRLIGKRYDAGFFLEAADHGMHFCDYLLASDMEMDPTPGYQFTSWAQGYGDALAAADWDTLRRAAWLEKSALVLCDTYDRLHQGMLEIAPRTILRRQVERAQAAGFLPMMASELEFFAFQETYQSAHDKHYDGLQTFGNYIEDYHLPDRQAGRTHRRGSPAFERVRRAG